ncbi:hypothetical protein [Sporosarcina sp. YIM B06819]|uniref:hypothetical protein n=1 Tax=Sporosarcina sp. YIM B06819 TaxID=3081769 RepID=UPI00298C8EB7|nr:hypothetical protein [Sporosarcina sp. YIM B06819]
MLPNHISLCYYLLVSSIPKGGYLIKNINTPKIFSRIGKQFKVFRVLLVVDELSEANRIIKFLGLSFIILAFFYLLGLVKLSAIIIICISLSGIFFIIGDIFEHFCKVQFAKKAIDARIINNRIGHLKLFKLGCQFSAIISLIVAPYLTLTLADSMLNKVSNTLAMLAIGLTVFKIGLDNSMKKSEFEDMLIEELSKLAEETTTPQQDKNK